MRQNSIATPKYNLEYEAPNIKTLNDNYCIMETEK